jgi:hypothetical protein
VYGLPYGDPVGTGDYDGDGTPDAYGGVVVVITPEGPDVWAEVAEVGAVGYTEVGTMYVGAEGAGAFEMVEYDYGCSIGVETPPTGLARLCVRYLWLKSISVLGNDIPTWPFVGGLVVLVLGLIIRR